ncbi:MAG: hypothetical protein U0992_08155 [Planctomycetaceae bacterium]
MANPLAALWEVRRFAPSRVSAATFLVALLGLLAAAPVLQETPTGGLIETFLMTIVLIAAIPAAGGGRGTILIASILAVPAVVGKWLHTLHPDWMHHEWFLAAGIVFGAYVVAQHLVFILRAQTVDTQVLCAGVSTFLMLGLLWTFGFMLLSDLAPGSIMMELEPGAQRPLAGFGAVYLSLATLCGGVCPEIEFRSNIARMLALFEGITAMFYVTILIARLVALSSERSRS